MDRKDWFSGLLAILCFIWGRKKYDDHLMLQDSLLLLTWLLGETSGDESCLERVVCLNPERSARYLAIPNVISSYLYRYSHSWNNIPLSKILPVRNNALKRGAHHTFRTCPLSTVHTEHQVARRVEQFLLLEVFLKWRRMSTLHDGLSRASIDGWHYIFFSVIDYFESFVVNDPVSSWLFFKYVYLGRYLFFFSLSPELTPLL